MKLWMMMLGLLAGCLIAAQEPDGNLFSTVRPDVIVIVREHETTAEMVQVTVMKEGYPSDLLKRQLDQMAAYLGSTARGIQMTSPDLGTKSKISFIRAEFATDGLIDRKLGLVRLGPIVKAFAGAPEPYTISGIKIAFENERTTKKMHRKLPIPGVLNLEGRASSMPAGIEYQVQLLSQDAEKIVIPDEYAPPANQQPVSEPSSSPNRALLIGLFVLAGVALGALVYLALLRTGGARK
jgi:hypothetical protein